MWGDETWTKRQEERVQREAALDEEQWNQGTELEKLLKKAETDLEASRLVELARLLDPSSFKQRDEGLERVRKMRLSPQGNDPSFQNAIRVHERVARLSIQYAIRKAEAVLGLVRSWE
jgi:hypothetical protein